MHEDDAFSMIKFIDVSFWERAYGVPFTCFSMKTVEFIANILGKFVTFDDSDYLGWTFALCFKVTIPLAQLLRRGVLLKLDNGTVKWISIRYEHLPCFCYSCGCMGHIQKEC
uniref:CCHC-type domain-containing protein n=1 Tax=Manihot esculenta TaxID=3983 RepID=A0A2C9UQN7_MANES